MFDLTAKRSWQREADNKIFALFFQIWPVDFEKKG